MPGASEETERGVDRLVFFSDAVVAIAITLLILPVVDAVSATGPLSDVWHDAGSRILAFALSFAVIARFWIVHHHVFEFVARYDMRLLWLNMAWLAAIVFVPFPTELLGVRGTDEAGVRFLYIASLLAISTLLLALEALVLATPALWAGERRPGFDATNAAVTVGALVVALVVGTAVPVIGLWALLLLLPTDALAGWIAGRRASSGDPPEHR